MKSDSATSSRNADSAKKAFPEFEDFVLKRDYTGARTFLEFTGSSDPESASLTDQWIAFCNFHLGDYAKALHNYQAVQRNVSASSAEVTINVAVCMFYLGE